MRAMKCWFGTKIMAGGNGQRGGNKRTRHQPPMLPQMHMPTIPPPPMHPPYPYPPPPPPGMTMPGSAIPGGGMPPPPPPGMMAAASGCPAGMPGMPPPPSPLPPGHPTAVAPTLTRPAPSRSRFRQAEVRPINERKSNARFAKMSRMSSSCGQNGPSQGSC